MKILLSPSKTINYKIPKPGTPITTPMFLDHATILVDALLENKEHFSRLLGISDTLTQINIERYEHWSRDAQVPYGERAAWAFRGEVYFGLAADSMTEKQLSLGQKTIYIMSGLYGLLRITDCILPHRLEMNTKLKGYWGKNLYDFWGDKLAQSLLQDKPKYVINCASEEYIKAIRAYLQPNTSLITPRFLHNSANGLKPKMTFSKWSRGLFARWIINNEPASPDDLQYFDAEGYSYSAQYSKPNEPAFVAPKGLTLKGRYKKI